MYPMEHLFFDLQLCIEISIFNEFSEFPTKTNLSKLRLGSCSSRSQSAEKAAAPVAKAAVGVKHGAVTASGAQERSQSNTSSCSSRSQKIGPGGEVPARSRPVAKVE